MMKRVNIVEYLIEMRADLNITDESTGTSCLMYAVLKDLNMDIIKAMIGRGAEINISDLRLVTPVIVACSVGNPTVLDLFLKTADFVDIDHQDDNGWTALHHAVYSGNPQCVEICLAYGVDKQIKAKNGRKAIDLARYMDHGDCLSHLEDLKSRIAFELGED